MCFPDGSREGADAGEARDCSPWAIECSHTGSSPWVASHKSKSVPSGSKRPSLGLIVLHSDGHYHGDGPIMKKGRPDRADCHL